MNLGTQHYLPTTLKAKHVGQTGSERMKGLCLHFSMIAVLVIKTICLLGIFTSFITEIFQVACK